MIGHILFSTKIGYMDGLKVHLYIKQSWNVPVFSICHILVALCMDETQMHIYRQGCWYVNKISSLSVGLIPIQWYIICVLLAGGEDNITHLYYYCMSLVTLGVKVIHHITHIDIISWCED